MPVFDIGNACAVVPLHNPGTYSADRDGASVDTANFAYGVMLIHAGNIVSGQQVLFNVEHADTVGGTYSACNKLGTNSSAQIRVQNAQDNTCLIVRIDFNNTKRFIRARADHSGLGGHAYGVSMFMVPYQTDATSSDTGAAYAPFLSI